MEFSRSRGLIKDSSPYKPTDPGGTMVVGDGKTSVKRCGGPLGESLFHMLLLQGKEALLEWPLPKVALDEVPALEPQGN